MADSEEASAEVAFEEDSVEAGSAEAFVAVDSVEAGFVVVASAANLTPGPPYIWRASSQTVTNGLMARILVPLQH